MISKNNTIYYLVFIVLASLTNCKNNNSLPENFHHIGAMKEVMWNGKLGPSIKLDTLSSYKGLFGLGPESYLRGEIMIDNGQIFVSRITNNQLTVMETRQTSAPFFVYSHVNKWDSMAIPEKISGVKALEQFIIQQNKSNEAIKAPFFYRLKGSINSAKIHVQDLPLGTEVSSPKEAHQGQKDFTLAPQEVSVVGVFSTNHQGIFTHHDSYLHMHLITKDRQQMGHLDEIDMNKMMLYLPAN